MTYFFTLNVPVVNTLLAEGSSDMNPSGKSTQPFGFSNQSSQRMTSSNRFHPYTSSTHAQSYGGRLPLSSPASPYNSLPATAASAQNGALQWFNTPVGNATINYQNPHPDPALPRSAGYSRPASYNYQNTMSGRAGPPPTPTGIHRPNHVGVSQDRAFPSQLRQQALPLPSASQMMLRAGGDAFSPVSPVTSPNNQGKARVNKGNPARSQGLRVLSGRVGKVKVHFFSLN